MKKQCNKCGEKKLLSEFSKNKLHKGGLQYNCKECVNKYNERYRHPRKVKKCVCCESIYTPKTGNSKYCSDKCRKQIDSLYSEEYYYQRGGRKKRLERNLRQSYGIDFEEYDRMLEEQNGVCAICGNPERCIHDGKPRRLAVDHNHFTGKVRGLLCYRCNNRLGALENRDFVEKATEYLKRHET